MRRKSRREGAASPSIALHRGATLRLNSGSSLTRWLEKSYSLGKSRDYGHRRTTPSRGYVTKRVARLESKNMGSRK
jgi:hypothetical protein